MMLERVHHRLSFGDDTTCTDSTDGSVAVVHACKEPCHRRAVCYTTRTIPSNHSSYLVHERRYHLFLNLIDPPQPLFMMPSFVGFLAFVDREIAERDILIHCNKGESRAPSLALLYMAKRLRSLPDESYAAAAAAFRQQFPYNPGQGITTWLAMNWDAIK
jgi:predicted protein tyrosine phosphatase